MALRERQREHSFLLLNADEFAHITATGNIRLPLRHREHFGRILRRSDAWPALVGDGSGRVVQAMVINGTIEVKSEVSIMSRQMRPVTLVQAWVKQKALAWILQKASELGVAKIILVDSDFSSPHSEKSERMQAIIENACMQAYNPIRPALHTSLNLQEIPLNRESAFFGDLAATLKLTDVRPGNAGACVFLNGPEGGWSPKETELLRQNAQGVLLSENVLRADTAAIIAAGFLTLQ